MDYQQAINEIYNLKGSEHKGHFNLSLKNIKILLKKLNNPEKDLKVIHIAGTNGKGSVCAMLSSILKEANYKVGMYTSPHLKDFRERFLINNKKVSKQEITRQFEKIKPHITDQTFFEVVTAMAFLYFKEKKVDYLICEVGLGGRLDATNVVNPIISVITNIGLEHQEYLGETIEEIAYEKAGIIKEKIPAITGTKGVALKVIKKVAKEKQAILHHDGRPIKALLKLRGEFQLKNASLALETIKLLNKYHNLKIDKNAIKRGFLNTIWHGRLEFLSENVLVDCAHNLDAIKALKKELKQIKNKNIYLIIGILKDKDHKKILKELTPLAKRTIITRPNIPRAQDPKILAKQVKDPIIIEDTKKALDQAKKMAKKDDLILITGSIYVVGEAI